MNYCFLFREKGLSDVCDLIEEVMMARMDQLEEEKSNQIPECPVNIELYSTLSDKFPQCFIS